jgi:hypothetical protein
VVPTPFPYYRLKAHLAYLVTALPTITQRGRRRLIYPANMLLRVAVERVVAY